MNYLQPLTRRVDLTDGTIPNAHSVVRRHLSDMEGLYADPDAEAELRKDDPLVYEVFEATDLPKEDGHLLFSTTILRPGRVGHEYFMTKGHFHARSDRAELYYGVSGRGILLLMTPEGEVDAQEMVPGAASYVPPHWGHRTVNTGDENFVFLAVYPADAGYDYGTIADRGFAEIVVAGAEGPELAPNPHYRA
jgi:glucose-6-phosphate isomerase